MYLGEPVVHVIIPVAGALLFGVVVGEPEPGIVMPQHGAILEGVLYQALVVRAGFLKHVIEGPRVPRASGILAFCGCDQVGLEDGLLPLATLFLSFGEVGNRGLRGLVPPLPLGVVLGEDGPNSLFA